MSFGRRETRAHGSSPLSGESHIVFDADPHYVAEETRHQQRKASREDDAA
jgi:hypothetical protein